MKEKRFVTGQMSVAKRLSRGDGNLLAKMPHFERKARCGAIFIFTRECFGKYFFGLMALIF